MLTWPICREKEHVLEVKQLPLGCGNVQVVFSSCRDLSSVLYNGRKWDRSECAKSEKISLFGSFCLFYVNCKISLPCRLELSTFNIAGNLKSVSGGECIPLKFVKNSFIRCIRFVATSAHVSPMFPKLKIPFCRQCFKKYVGDGLGHQDVGRWIWGIHCVWATKHANEGICSFLNPG